MIFAVFAVWGRHIGRAMSLGRLTGNEGRFSAHRIISALCAIGATVRAVTEATHRVGSLLSDDCTAQVNHMTETVNSFSHAHATSAAMLLVAFLAGIGYLETRLFPKARMMAGSTWAVGLLILCFALSGLPISGGLGALFIVVWIGLGIAGMVWFFR